MLDHAFSKFPFAALLTIILLSLFCNPVICPPLAIIRVSGKRFEISVLLHPGKRGIQGRFLNDITVICHIPDPLRDLVAIGWGIK